MCIAVNNRLRNARRDTTWLEPPLFGGNRRVVDQAVTIPGPRSTACDHGAAAPTASPECNWSLALAVGVPEEQLRQLGKSTSTGDGFERVVAYMPPMSPAAIGCMENACRAYGIPEYDVERVRRSIS